ncbi:hypothetical protein [Streptomyces chiangmaiensis]|uniref:Gram-positive cocci surface proteins LPxTG domain-containing protein n=1 Tax=Streptomyces chiangmaiensis TaxID=766497 RepID=A0ABU7FLS7_9ACTN|nr:hypothetical protein [Streptomyces chiangmaiensis]MED7824768.1 hypothetical protein [Streptomyces chiangmaiensis]
MRLSRRPRLAPAVPCALAATVLLPQASATTLTVDRQTGCAAPTGTAFPLTTRIHGGPGTYEPGGAAQTWFIDLKNTTARPCGSIHPVVVLVDAARVLTVTQPRLEFFDGDRPQPVAFTRTDRAELVGVFGDGLPGFTVDPGRTLTVKVRLALTSDTRPNDVVVNAAIVQRHGNDGDWVGESNDYRFRIAGAGNSTDARTEAEEGTQPPAARRSPAGDTLADAGPRETHALDGMSTGLLVMVGAVLVAGLPVLLYRRRR